MPHTAAELIDDAFARGAATLDLSGLALTDDTVPADLQRLRRLKHLYLDGNRLTRIPDAVFGLADLETLRVNRNRIHTVPKAIGTLTNLRSLDLARNRLTALPREIWSLTELRTLKLALNDIRGLPSPAKRAAHLNVVTDDGFRQRESIISMFSDLTKVSAPDIEFREQDPNAAIADGLEKQARAALMQGEELHADVPGLLRRAMEAEPARAERLRAEFGFLLERSPEYATDPRFEWRRNIWWLLAARNLTLLRDDDRIEAGSASPPAAAAALDVTLEDLSGQRMAIQTPIARVTTDPGAWTPAPLLAPSAPDTPLTPEQKGEQLEQSVVTLLRGFFRFDEHEEKVLDKLRQQRRGPQLGRDIDLEWRNIDVAFAGEAADNHAVRCHIECKNVTGSLSRELIVGKLSAYDVHDTDIDQWILISPHVSPSNELNEWLDRQRTRPRYPFEIQVWSPDTGVETFFGLNPAVHQAIYGARATERPSDWNVAERENVRKRWRAKLRPALRLPGAWERYIRDSSSLLMKGEVRAEMNVQYQNPARVYGRTDNGVLLSDKTLESQVEQWLNSDSRRTLLLLGEFGDGKTFFTYLFSRRLLESFQREPASGWIPIRFRLRDFPFSSERRSFVQDAHQFVKQRLESLGQGLEHWAVLRRDRRVLAILDGFDEMSRTLDRASIQRNILAVRTLLADLDVLDDCKVLVTSRTHVLERQLKEQVLRALDRPLVLRLAPLSRKEVYRHLESHAIQASQHEALSRMRTMYDPIGLGVKPLLLAMLKATLATATTVEDLTVVGLYKEYVHKALIRKVAETAHDDMSIESDEQRVARLIAILVKIAIYLQKNKLESVALSTWAGADHREWARMLWDSANDDCAPADGAAADEDASARVGTRGLLTRVETADSESKWTVDFYHRSVREYFVALGIVTALRQGAREAIALLTDTPLNQVIIDFAAGLLSTETSFDVDARLIEVIRALSRRSDTRHAHVGGHCLTILYRTRGAIPGRDWIGLALNGADLSGADLSSKDFSGSSLREARFDNVNLEDANLSDCDLRGATLEETAPVDALCATSDRTLIAAYTDGAIREWSIEPHGGATRRVVLPAGSHNVDRMGLAPTGDIWVITTNGDLVLYEQGSDGVLERCASFAIRRDLIELTFHGDLVVALEEIKAQRVVPAVIDPARATRIHVGPESAAVVCALVGERHFIVSDREQGLTLVASDGQRSERVSIDDAPVSAVSWRVVDNRHFVAAGYETGEIKLWSLALMNGAWMPTEVCRYQAHDGMVTSLAFLNDEMVLSGGRDRRIAVASFDYDPSHSRLLWGPVHFSLTLRCAGLSFKGLKGPVEYERLEGLVRAVSASDD